MYGTVGAANIFFKEGKRLGSDGEDTSRPKGIWARLYTSDSQAAEEAADLLRSSGYRVITLSEEAKLEPELVIGRRRFRGLEEIRAFLSTEG